MNAITFARSNNARVKLENDNGICLAHIFLAIGGTRSVRVRDQLRLGEIEKELLMHGYKIILRDCISITLNPPTL